MTNKKRILLLTRPICPPWDDALKNFPYDIARNIENSEIVLLVKNTLPDLPENIIQKSIYTSPKWTWDQKIRAYIFLIKEFFIKDGKEYGAIHSFFTPTKLNIFALKLLIRNKNIKTIQTITTLREDLHSAEDFKKIIFADYIITYSDYAKEKLKEVGFGNVKRIYPGIDLQKYSPAPKNPELLRRYDTRADDFVINYTGEYVRLGDMDDVVESFIDLVWDAYMRPESEKAAYMRPLRKNLKLHLAVRVKNQKDSDKKTEIVERLKKENISDQVAFIDDQNYEMPDIYNLCDLSIFPARTMAGKFDIPLAVIEAMACGKPVIVSNLERLKCFLNDNNSILINPGDREALKEKILYLYNNPENRQKLGEKGMQFVRENFDIMKVVKEYEELYNNL